MMEVMEEECPWEGKRGEGDKTSLEMELQAQREDLLHG